MYKLLAAGIVALAGLSACSADGESVVLEDESSSSKPVSSGAIESSSSVCDTVVVWDDPFEKLDSLFDFVPVPKSELKRGPLSFAVDSFDISKTELTQALYEKLMGTLPVMDKVGDSIPVVNISWYDAILFCNALAKFVGMDTAYIYDEVGDFNYLKNLTIDYGVESVRLPTETEWEIAYRAGTTSTYYWGTDVASKYAYYAQTNGPVKVGQYVPNAYGLYDMGGNVAEWVNDWFGAKPTSSIRNYTGASDGSLKVVRGGGWSDIAKVMAADSTVKKDPISQSEKIGMRLVHSIGF